METKKYKLFLYRTVLSDLDFDLLSFILYCNNMNPIGNLFQFNIQLPLGIN